MMLTLVHYAFAVGFAVTIGAYVAIDAKRILKPWQWLLLVTLVTWGHLLPSCSDDDAGAGESIGGAP